MAHVRITEKEDRKMSDKEIIKRTWKYVKPYWFKFVCVLFLMGIMIALTLIGSIIPGQITQTLSTTIYEEVNISYAYGLCIAYFVCHLLNTALVYITTMSLQKIGESIIYDLRIEVFAHIESMDIKSINDIPVGSLVTRVSSDTNQLSNLFTQTLTNLIKNILTLIGVIIVMYIIDWRIASILMCFVPFILIISIIFRKYLRKNYRVIRHSFSTINAFLNENISGVKITQIYNQEAKKSEEFDELNNKLFKAQKVDIRLFALYRPAITLLYYLALAAIFGIGTYLYLKDVGLATTPEAKIAMLGVAIGATQKFYSLVSQFFNPIQNLADQLNQLQRAFTSCERLFNVLDTLPTLFDDEEAVELTEFKGDIEFKHVWFAYNAENWILKDVSFHVYPKQVVAFVGATGAGKTTILQLLVRNYDIQKGDILIDGVPIKKIKLSSLRGQIGQMLQDVFIFTGTVKDNITLNDESISMDEVNHAINYVNAEHFINKLPNGINEVIKEGGNNLSSGERQLLSFARTVCYKPKVLILDEATANIDTETEKVIQDSLSKMMNIGTMLIVAHRLSTIQHSDNIICLKNGEIIEQGNHQSLLAQKGYYYNLYRLQYQDQENQK